MLPFSARSSFIAFFRKTDSFFSSSPCPRFKALVKSALQIQMKRYESRLYLAANVPDGFHGAARTRANMYLSTAGIVPSWN